MRKRVLILNWRSPYDSQAGGAEKVTLRYAEALINNNYNVVWLAGAPKKRKEVKNIPSELKIIEVGNPLTVYILAPIIYWLQFKGNFDLVIDQIHGLPFLTPLWAFKSKRLAFIHEVALEIWNEMFPFPLNVVGRLFEKIYFRLYKKTSFLTVSPSTAKDLIRFGISNSNLNVIPNGLDVKPLNSPSPKFRHLTLIFVGRLVKMKGVEEAIRTVSFLKFSYPNIKLYIVGEGSQKYVDELLKIVDELGLTQNITFLGFISEEEKIKLYRKSHFLIHTSVREGFGLVILEANSQGTPAIVYNSPGLRDVVKKGINGYQVPRGNSRKMASVIKRLFESKVEYQHLSRSSIRYASEFKWITSQKQFVKLVRKLIKVSN